MDHKINISFSQKDIEALSGLLDCAVKYAGLRAVPDAGRLMALIEEALAKQEQNGNS